MYILYADDAGSVSNHTERHFVLGGIALYEAHAYFLQQALDGIANKSGLADPATLELHGNEILAGRKRWRAMRDRTHRRQLIKDALQAAFDLKGDWRLFGVVIDKAAVAPRDSTEYAFEQLCSRFDAFLQRKKFDGKNQKGIIVFDKSTQETRIQSLTSTFRQDGHSWGKIRTLADVPFFVDSKATRAVQYADLVTYALWRYFEKSDDEFFNIIAKKFDTDGGVVHGLLHERYANSTCPCPYCKTRRR